MVGQSWSRHSWLSWPGPGHCEVMRPSLATEPSLGPSHLLCLVLLPGPQEVEQWLQSDHRLQAGQGWPQLSCWLG